METPSLCIRFCAKTKTDNCTNDESVHPPAAGTVMTPNYLRTPKISVSPYCDCSNSGNNKDECDKFTEFFSENTCLREFIYLLFWVFFFLLLCSVGLYSYLVLWIHFPLLPYFLPLCFAGFSPILLFLSSLFFSCLSLLTKYIPLPMLALLSCCIIAKPVTLHRRAWMCVRLYAHLCVCVCVRACVCVCVCPRAVAELLLQIFDRKRLFHPALLHNGFN